MTFLNRERYLMMRQKSRINPFDWNSKSVGFGEIMESGGFDVVIGNPPYGALFADNEDIYFLKQFKVFVALKMYIPYSLSVAFLC